MATRRGFLGALFGATAATAGGVLIPELAAAKEKIKVSTTPQMAESLRKAADGEVIACDASMIPNEFFESRTNLYRAWWNQASPKMWRMSDKQYAAFIEAHIKVNERFGVVVDSDKGPPLPEGDVGMLTPFQSAFADLEKDEYIE